MTLPTSPRSDSPSLRVAGLFAGIGGIEQGLHLAGHETVFLCEIEDSAVAVLGARLGLDVHRDICALDALPDCDVVTAGFPCQDLSSVGRTVGIGGSQSSLVEHVFRLVEGAARPPAWLLLENVPFMLRLERGEAMSYLVRRLGDLGYRWAYRVVDTRSFGLPQRRKRVVLLASRTEDPSCALFADDARPPDEPEASDVACGFYWTEGNRGLGWGVDCVPTLKGGSSVGIPSPPAIRLPGGRIVTPDIRDAERLQGFDPDWTLPAEVFGAATRGARWKLVGNAVSVPVARWVGTRLSNPGTPRRRLTPLTAGYPWPTAACGDGHATWAVDVGQWPVRRRHTPLESFLRYPTAPLSDRAATGFLTRLEGSSLRAEPWFLDELRAYVGLPEVGAVRAAA